MLSTSSDYISSSSHSLISKPRPMYPRASSMTSLQSLILEETASSSGTTSTMLSENQRNSNETQHNVVTTDGLLLLALQERLNNQLRPNTNQQSMNSPLNADVNTRLWQSLMLGLPVGMPLTNQLDLNYFQTAQQPVTHPLWQHGLCAWPGCNQPCENLAIFLQHISQIHVSDERAASDMKTQVEVVDTLEHRLAKEKNKLQAMMQHLHMKHSPDTTTPTVGKLEPLSPLRSPKQEPLASTSICSIPPASSAPIMTSTPQQIQFQITSTMPLVLGESSSTPSVSASDPSPNSDNRGSNLSSRRSRISDKTVLPISAEIARNRQVWCKNGELSVPTYREYYRTHDARPPYTYASLIRQAIMESSDCQLTLNEIYTWFTETFAYFRRNAATWKNAVRHNLSLHKCFQRVEQNVKGAVWTVDDSEFYRRRPQRSSATRSQPNTPIPDEVLAQRLIDQTTMGLLDRPEVSVSEGLSLNSGLEGVLSFLAQSASDHRNPLALLSAAAAVSESSSTPVTPAPRDESINGMVSEMALSDSEAMDVVGDIETTVSTSC